jgi:hypothetical protein
MEVSNNLTRTAGLKGVGIQENMDSLTPGNPGARTGSDMITKSGAILNVALRCQTSVY